MTQPEFSDDSTEQTLAQGKGDLSSTPIKGSLKWDKRDGEYVFLWFQKPFRIATDNGAYSMTEDLLESIPDHIEKFWVADEDNYVLRRFERNCWEDDSIRKTIEPGDPLFNNVNPAVQHAVDVSYKEEEYPLSDFPDL